MTTSPPTTLLQHHLKEFAASAIPEEVATKIFRSESDSKAIAKFLGWNGYKGSGGWIVTGINPETGADTGIGQFKPDTPITFPDGNSAKYLTQKDEHGRGRYDALCLPVPEIDWKATLDDPTIPIRIVEGAKKSVCSMVHTNVPSVAVSGVDMATIGRAGKLTPTLAALAVRGRPVEIAYDSDIIEKTSVRGALIGLATSLVRAGCIVSVRTWSLELGKGLDDLIANVNAENFETMTELASYKDWLKSLEGQFSEKGDRRGSKPPAQSTIAKAIAERYRHQLAWNPHIKKWYRCGAEVEGIWTKEIDEFVAQVIKAELDTKDFEYSADYLGGVLKLLKVELAVKTWDEAPGLIPFRNAVLDLKTMKVKPHSSIYRLTWYLPYDYDSKATCEPIINWMREMTQGDETQVQLLRAYLAAIVRGRRDLQRYLELIGPGGSGKSTYLQLAMAIVGTKNCHITTLQKLENSRFETACIEGKRLVLITDSDRYVGSVSLLKALTGGDSIPYEEKFIQSEGGFFPKALVLVAANEPIQSSDYTSGLQRRRISVAFSNRIPRSKQRNLIDFVDGKIEGEFVEYLPGLLNWVLQVSDQEIENYIRRTDEFVGSLSEMQAQILCDTNPIADWIDFSLVYAPGERTQVGVAQRDKSSDSKNCYLNVSSWLYANYCEYSVNTGSKPVALRRFVHLLHDLCVNQLNLSVRHGRLQTSYFEGLKIRTEWDADQPRIVTGPRLQPLPMEAPTPEPEPEPPPVAVAPKPPTPRPEPTLPPPPPPPPEPNWKEFPGTGGSEARRNRAQQIRKEMLAQTHKSGLEKLKKRFTHEQMSWVFKNLMVKHEREQIKGVLSQEELDLG